MARIYSFIGLMILLAGCASEPLPPFDMEAMAWEEIEAQANGQDVNLVMWMGDPFINEYMRGYVAPAVKERYGINLTISSGQGSQIVSMLMTEKEAGKAASEFDIMWINGETFYQLRQIDALFGPFTDKLPNSQYIDFENPFIGIDFQQPIDGYECPWGNVQMAFIYDSARTANPPKNRAELATWVQEHPGRFTFDNAFTGMTLLKALLIDIAGGPEALQGPFNQEAYNRYAPQLWHYLNSIKTYFWQRGETFPNGVAQMHQLFKNGEIDFSISNNDAGVDNKVLQGVFPETSRAYVLDSGTIQNSHYMGIVSTAPNKAGALVTLNFLVSPEAQLRKQDPNVWGDGTVLDIDKLPADWQAKFQEAQALRRYAPPRDSIEDKALQELAPEYMIRLYEDFRTHVIEAS